MTREPSFYPLEESRNVVNNSLDRAMCEHGVLSF